MKLSVCMIVKNEESVLGRCLACAVQFADELIVVDTGSTDRTVEIARQYTPHVYLHPWRQSFAEARNYSYSKATGDYVMWLDADDVISPENIARFNALKESLAGEVDVVFTTYSGYSETGLADYILRDRIIRRSLNPRWEYDIHEGIPMASEWKRFDAADIEVVHKKEHVNEPGRNLAIFRHLLDEQRELTTFEKVNLCKEYALNGHHAEAIGLYLDTAPAMRGHERDYAFSFVRHSFMHEKRYRECIDEIGWLTATFPRSAMVAYTEALCMERLGDDAAAERLYLEALTIPENPSTLSIVFKGYNDYYPLLQLAGIAERRGDRKEALGYLARAGQAYPKDEAWQKMRLRVMLMPQQGGQHGTAAVAGERLEELKKEFDALYEKLRGLPDDELRDIIGVV